MPTSTRVIEAFKTALAMSLVYGIALSLGWEKPYWAAFAVGMISLSTLGQSVNKGAMRMLGTFVGAIVALVFLSWFPQERWLFLTVSSIYVSGCVYMMAGKRRQTRK